MTIYLNFYARIVYTLMKKKTKFALLNKEIQMGSVTKLFMRKGFLIQDSIWGNAQKFNHIWVIHDFATDPFWISLYTVYEENVISFLSV